MIRRNKSANGFRLVVDSLEGRELLSLFGALNDSPSSVPTPFETAMPIVLSVDYIQISASDGPTAALSFGLPIANGQPSPANPPPFPSAAALGGQPGDYPASFAPPTLEQNQVRMPGGDIPGQHALILAQPGFDSAPSHHFGPGPMSFPGGGGPTPGSIPNNAWISLPIVKGAPFEAPFLNSLVAELDHVLNGNLTIGNGGNQSDVPPPPFYSSDPGSIRAMSSEPPSPMPELNGGPHPVGPIVAPDNFESFIHAMEASLNPNPLSAPSILKSSSTLSPDSAASPLSIPVVPSVDHHSSGVLRTQAELSVGLPSTGESSAQPIAAANNEANGGHAMSAPPVALSGFVQSVTGLSWNLSRTEYAVPIGPASLVESSSRSITFGTSATNFETADMDIAVPLDSIPPANLEAATTPEAHPAQGSDLLFNFLPGDATRLGAAVDRFLDRLQDLGNPIQPSHLNDSYASDWGVVVTVGAVVLEIGRRRLLKRKLDESAADGIPPGSRLAGWPGSWTARIP